MDKSKRNHEILTANNLLNEKGNLKDAGWSKRMLLKYRRSDVKAPKWRIKEWDYYLISNNDFAIALTVSDNGYFGLQSVSFMDFKVPFQKTSSIIDLLTMGKLNMPNTSNVGNVFYKSSKLNIEFLNNVKGRHIICDYPNFDGDKALKCDIVLSDIPEQSMVIATPMHKDKHFYYNQKINCMKACGYVLYGEKRYDFDINQSFATLDWGRGVWTYDNTWYWANGNSYVDGKPFGFNLGNGFGDTSKASENIIIYDGVISKLDDIQFQYNQENYMDKWLFTSSDGRFEAQFEPIIDRFANMDLKLISSNQHQVFGHLSGYTILDNHKRISFENMLCFVERVDNKF